MSQRNAEYVKRVKQAFSLHELKKLRDIHNQAEAKRTGARWSHAKRIITQDR